MKPNKAVVYMVVGSFVYVVLAYTTTLGYLAVTGQEATLANVKEVLSHFKEFAIYAAGGVSGFLARTGSVPESPTDSAPIPVKNVNTTTDPVITQDVRETAP